MLARFYVFGSQANKIDTISQQQTSTPLNKYINGLISCIYPLWRLILLVQAPLLVECSVVILLIFQVYAATARLAKLKRAAYSCPMCCCFVLGGTLTHTPLHPTLTS